MSEPIDAVAAGPPARLEVVAGGDPSDAELAALVIALTPVAAPPPAAGRADVARTPAWARAALLEGVGHRPPIRPSDLDAAARLG